MAEAKRDPLPSEAGPGPRPLPAGRAAPPRKASPKAKGKSIVLADSDAALREAIGELLGGRGYEVHPAGDGLECLLAIRSLRPSFVILDIVMPKIDGSRVCWLVRQDRSLRHTPIIAFSALSPKDIRRFPELSADAYVAKGQTATAGQSVLRAVDYLEGHGRRDLAGGIFGYEGFRPRKLTGEMLLLKRHYEGLMRAFGCGVMELDPAGHILMANARAIEMVGRQEYRLVGERLPSIFPPGVRHRLEEILRSLGKARLPEEHRMAATLGEREIGLRFFTTVEEGECIGVLLTLEPRDSAARGRD